MMVIECRTSTCNNCTLLYLNIFQPLPGNRRSTSSIHSNLNTKKFQWYLVGLLNVGKMFPNKPPIISEPNKADIRTFSSESRMSSQGQLLVNSFICHLGSGSINPIFHARFHGKLNVIQCSSIEWQKISENAQHSWKKNNNNTTTWQEWRKYLAESLLATALIIQGRLCETPLKLSNLSALRHTLITSHRSFFYNF